MIKAFITNAVASKGYNGAPALNFSENNGATTAVQFKIGHRVYDSRAEGKHRYINLAAKAFGQLCERIEKMKLMEGSYVNITGRLDEDVWEEEGQKRSRFVVIVEDIEYAYNGGKENGGKGANAATGTGAAPIPQNGQGAVPPQDLPRQSAQPAPAAQPTQAPPPATPPQQTQGGQAEMPPNFTGYTGFGGENPFFPGS